MIENPRITRVNWKICDDLKAMMPLFKARGGVDVIVGILRGGSVVATMMSHGLDVPTCWCQAKSYVKKEQADLEIELLMKPEEIEGKSVLVCDDIFDSGTTMLRVLSLCRVMGAKSVMGLVLISKDERVCNDNDISYLMKCPKDEWILFPWEFDV